MLLNVEFGLSTALPPFLWTYSGVRQFILPPVQIGTYPAHGKDRPEVLTLPPGGIWLRDRGPRLGNLLREGAVFQYRYHDNREAAPRTVQVQFKRCIPDCTEEVPVCTACQGESPQEWVVRGITEWIYREITCIKGDPRQQWLQNSEGFPLEEDTPASVTARLDSAIQWLVFDASV